MTKLSLLICSKIMIFITVIFIIFVITPSFSVEASTNQDFGINSSISHPVVHQKIKHDRAGIKINLYDPNCTSSEADNPSQSNDCLSAQSVRVTDFTARSVKTHILVSWKTTPQHDSIAFNLYRGTDKESPSTPLNKEVISAPTFDNNQEWLYEWKDREVKENTSYYYWLEEVEQNDSDTLHGPVIVLHQSPTAVEVSEMKSLPSQENGYPLIGIALISTASLLRLYREHKFLGEKK